LIELATLVVTGNSSSGRIPTRLVDRPRIPNLPVARRRTRMFRTDLSGRAGLGVIGYVEEKTFDPDRIDQRVEAGTVEEWTIRNADVMQHPIHIHINPFQVVDVQGIPSGDTS
jgi:FtsP/CotA-like multicopper oxidase with cupredoxin domain